MRVVVSESEAGKQYWQGRAVEAEERVVNASSRELRSVYGELLDHYQKMAKLYGTAP